MRIALVKDGKVQKIITADTAEISSESDTKILVYASAGSETVELVAEYETAEEASEAIATLFDEGHLAIEYVEM